LIAQAVEAEFETFLGSNADSRPCGRPPTSGFATGTNPVRAIQTGIGSVDVEKPKARDRGAAAGGRIRFTSAILPKWARRTKSLDALLPVLYLRGVSAGDFQEALAALLGKDAPNLSPAVIARLKERVGRRISAMAGSRFVRRAATSTSGGRRLSAGAHGAAGRMHAGSDRRDAEGVKELIGFQTGMRGERAKLEGIARRFEGARFVDRAGVAIGDGALGFWNALDEALPTTRHQRCCCTKTRTCSTSFPSPLQPNAHKDLRDNLAGAGSRQRGGRHDGHSPRNTRPNTTRPSIA